MGAYHIVRWLHLLSLLGLAAGITLFGVCYARLRAAESGADAQTWTSLAGRTGWLFPVSILGLFASGAYLTADRWSWTAPWIDVSIAALVLVTLQGPLVAGPRASALVQALQRNGPGRLGPPARAAARDRALWIVLLANPGVVLAIAWNMAAKPAMPGAIAAVVAGYAAGALAALALTRRE